MNTITAAEYVALDRKPIVIYKYRAGSFMEGYTVKIGNAAIVPDEWLQTNRSIALIKADSSGKVYVEPDTVLEFENQQPHTATAPASEPSVTSE